MSWGVKSDVFASGPARATTMLATDLILLRVRFDRRGGRYNSSSSSKKRARGIGA
jgi:hypothetical protein